MRQAYTIKVDRRFWIAIADLVHDTGDVWVVTRINVPVGHRREGIGTRLLQMICEDADHDLVTLSLAPMPSDNTMVVSDLERWYGKHGFIPDTTEGREGMMVRFPVSFHIRWNVRYRVYEGSPITWHEWEMMRMNSYEREVLYPLLDDEALCNQVEQMMQHVEFSLRKPYVTYNDSVLGCFVPELIKRLRLTMVEGNTK